MWYKESIRKRITVLDADKLKQIHHVALEGGYLDDEATSIFLKLVDVKTIDFGHAEVKDDFASTLVAAIETGKLPDLIQINMDNARISMFSRDRIQAVIDSRNSELKVKVDI